MPRPAPFVVKNGSKIRARVGASMPTPVSRTASTASAPAGTSGPAGRRGSSSASRVTSTTSRPPRGIASRAFTTRFRSASSTWPESAHTTAGPRTFTASATSSPRTRRSIRSMPAAISPTSTRRGARCWRREKARSWRVSTAARSLASMISRASSCPAWSAGSRSRSALAAERITVRRLLKSWATPPASCPTASIFWTCRSCSSRKRFSRSRSSSARAMSSKDRARSPISSPRSFRPVRAVQSPAAIRRDAAASRRRRRTSRNSATSAAAASARTLARSEPTSARDDTRCTGSSTAASGTPASTSIAIVPSGAVTWRTSYTRRTPSVPSSATGPPARRAAARRRPSKARPAQAAPSGRAVSVFPRRSRTATCGALREVERVEVVLQPRRRERREHDRDDRAAVVDDGVPEPDRPRAPDPRDDDLADAEATGPEGLAVEGAVGQVDRAARRGGAAEDRPVRAQRPHVDEDRLARDERGEVRAAGRAVERHDRAHPREAEEEAARRVHRALLALGDELRDARGAARGLLDEEPPLRTRRLHDDRHDRDDRDEDEREQAYA